MRPSVLTPPTDTPCPELQARLLRLTDGEPMLMLALEETLYAAYRDAGAPFGPTQHGLWRWWQHGQGTTLQ